MQSDVGWDCSHQKFRWRQGHLTLRTFIHVTSKYRILTRTILTSFLCGPLHKLHKCSHGMFMTCAWHFYPRGSDLRNQSRNYNTFMTLLGSNIPSIPPGTFFWPHFQLWLNVREKLKITNTRRWGSLAAILENNYHKDLGHDFLSSLNFCELETCAVRGG